MIPRLIKIISAVIGAMLVLIVLSLIGADAWLKTDKGQAILRDLVNAAIPGRIDWDNSSISLLAGRVSLQNAAVKGPDGEMIIAADELILDLNLAGLLSKTLFIENARLASPRIQLCVDEKGNLNLAGAFVRPSPVKKPEPKPEHRKSSADGLPIGIRVTNLELTDGKFSYRIAPAAPGKPAQSIVLRQIGFHVKNGDFSGKSGWIAANIGYGAIDIEGFRTGIQRFSLEAALHDGRIDPLALDIRTTGPNLTATGSVSGVFGEPRVNLDVDVSTDLSLFRDYFDLTNYLNLDGPVRLKFNASGDPNNPKIVLDGHYGGGRLPSFALNAIDLKARMENYKIDVEHLSANSASGVLAATGTVDMREVFDKGFFGDSSLDFEKFGYDSHFTTRDFNMARFPWTWDLLGGLVQGNFSIKGIGVYPTTMKAEATIDLSADGFRVKDGLPPIDMRVTAAARMAGGRITADPLVVEKENTVFRVTGGYQLFENTMDVTLKVNTPNIAQILSPYQVPVVSGKSELTAGISGYVLNLAISADLKANGVHYQDIAVGDVAAAAKLASSGKLTIDSLRIAKQGSEIHGKGTIDLFNGSFADYNYRLPADLRATFKNIDLMNFTTTVPAEGLVTGELRLARSFANPDATLRFTACDAAYDGTGLGELAGVLKFRNGDLAVEDLYLQKENSRLSAAGLLGRAAGKKKAFNLFRDGLSLKERLIDMRLADAAVYAEDFTDQFSGRLLLDGRLQGPVENISADIGITGAHLAAGSQEIGDLNARIGFADGTFRLDPVAIHNGKSDFAVTGTVRMFNPDPNQPSGAPALDLDISGNGIHLSDYGDFLAGGAAIGGHIGGTTENLKGNLVLAGEKIELGSQKIENFRITSRFEGNRVYLEPAILTLAPGEQVRAEGWVSLEKTYAIRLTSAPINLKRIKYFRKADLTGGSMTLDFDGKGSFDNPGITGKITLNGLQFDRKTVPDLRVLLAVENRQVCMTTDSGFKLDARYNLDNRDFLIDSKFADTELAPYFNLAGLSDLSGRLTGFFKTSGSASNLRNASAKLSITSLSILQNKTPLIRTSGLDVRLENGNYTVADTRLELVESGLLDIGGNGRLKGNINLHANGKIPFKVITAFVENIDNATGDVTISAEIGGTTDAPQYQGTIALDRIGMMVPRLMQTLHDVNGSIRISRDIVLIDGITGGMDSGSLDLKGRIDLVDFVPASALINLKATAVPIQVPDTIDLLVNSDLTLKGTPDDSRLSGKIIVLEGLYYKDFSLNLIGTIGDMTRRQRKVDPNAQTAAYKTPFLRHLNFNIGVGYRNPVMIDNNLALLSLKPGLRIRGTLNRPLLNGRAEVADGTINYRNTEFEVERGIVDFINPYENVPTIDIRAKTQVRTWKINLSVFGKPQNLDFKLTSDPEEEDIDIFSLLLTGQTTAELSGGTAGETSSPQEMLASIVANRFEEDIRKTTGFDVEFDYSAPESENETRITPYSEPVEIQGNGTEAITPAGDRIKVTVGKELTRRITVKYGFERKSGIYVHQQTAVLKLLENLSVNAFQDTEGTFGGELRFRLEFR